VLPDPPSRSKQGKEKRSGLNAGAFLPSAPPHSEGPAPLPVLDYRPTMTPFTVNARLRPRFELRINIRIHSRTCGVLIGHTVDISESGIAVMLKLGVPLAELVKLDFTLSLGDVTILAIARQRNAFRYGFEFVDSSSAHEIIRHTCSDLAVTQALIEITR
jgi:hypothetical protein